MAEFEPSDGMRERIRPINPHRYPRNEHFWDVIWGNKVNERNEDRPYSRSGTQFTVSEGHPFRNSKSKGKSDLGGDFYTTKSWMEPLGGTVRIRNKIDGLFQYYSNYTGPLAAVDPGSIPYPDTHQSSKDDMDEYGTTAIARVKPTNPVASLTQALTELRNQGLPHLPGASLDWQSKTAAARNSGDEYLNYQFGWVPLVNDVKGFASVVTDAPSVIEQYRRGIGKPTRREYYFPLRRENTEKVLINSYAYPWGPWSASFFQGGSSQYGKLYFQEELEQERWFSGCFTYYFPSKIFGSKKLADLGILAHQLGLEPTPEVVWNVAPWSWAADWFANTGDVISNWTSFHLDGLVMVYGYMMEKTIVKHTYSMEGNRDHFGRSLPISDVVVVTETKQRYGATPYGFGLTWDGFSSFQASILGALGLTKGLR